MIQIFKVWVKFYFFFFFFFFFYEILRIFNNLSRENHGHEHGVCRGLVGGKLSFKKMSAGGRLICTSQEKLQSLGPNDQG